MFMEYLQYRPVTVLEDWNTELEGMAYLRKPDKQFHQVSKVPRSRRQVLEILSVMFTAAISTA